MNTEPNLVVLYVEDEESDVLFMRLAFQKAGLGEALQAVADGRNAIDYLTGTGPYSDRRQYPLPSVVLLDLNLPLITGFEVLQWVRGRPEFKALPVVVFTSSPRIEDEVKAKALGADEYFEKPNSAHQFGTVVQSVRKKWAAAANLHLN